MQQVVEIKKIQKKEYRLIRECGWLSGFPGFLFLKVPLQDECDYGYDNEYYYEPPRDFHGETGYPLHAHDKKHHNRKID